MLKWYVLVLQFFQHRFFEGTNSFIFFLFCSETAPQCKGLYINRNTCLVMEVGIWGEAWSSEEFKGKGLISPFGKQSDCGFCFVLFLTKSEGSFWLNRNQEIFCLLAWSQNRLKNTNFSFDIIDISVACSSYFQEK